MAQAFLFPGQGSQKVGMGKDFYETFEAVQEKFDKANGILGRDLKRCILEGPEKELKATQNTQPALFTVEAAICDVLASKGINPSFTLGHSLGEYSALYAAGIYSFADGLQIVAKRGALMAEAGMASRGTMAAIIGLSKEVIAEVLSEIRDGVVVPANVNSPEQIVISGDVAAIDSACEKLTAAGAKRAVKLPVSGAFHSPLMQLAVDAFEPFLESFTFNTPRCPVISNVTARAERDPAVIKELLVKQLLSPVRWVDSILLLKESGVSSCLEVGPGNVLKGLVRKCDRDINVVSCNTVDNLYSLTN